MPLDMVMYWTDIYGGDRYNPPESAPMWEFCDEDEAPEHMTFTDETGLVLIVSGADDLLS